MFGVNKNYIELKNTSGGFPGVGTDPINSVVIKITEITEINDGSVHTRSGMFYRLEPKQRELLLDIIKMEK